MTTRKKLRIGKIAYANVFPIFYMLERVCDCSLFEIVEGVPSELNAMLRAGTLDISPSSSVEYLNHTDLYTYIDGISISSRGPVGSVFLFSKKPLQDLSGEEIAVTNQSATSFVLLHLLFREAGIRDVRYVSTQRAELASANAFLLIGDDALIYRLRTGSGSKRFVYDLGEMWYQQHALPFVFALWIVRKDLTHDEAGLKLLQHFTADLHAAKRQSLVRLGEIAHASPLAEKLSVEELLSYWSKLDYELGEEHIRAMHLFSAKVSGHVPGQTG
ncbi:MAG TPA: menaquinone biosynthesis protein [Dissulfurispiraceae bacterium]|nr:menaquinone biosynthesis protein [Dissulfurispiraceae bacterium]